MALYFYQAFSKDGKKVTGTIDAPSLPISQRATEQNRAFIQLRYAKLARSCFCLGGSGSFQKKITPKDKILFTKQLAVLLKSGIPLLQALELLIEQFEGNLRSMLIAIKDEVKEGISFADALKKYPKVFDNIYVQLVRAGEASGKLEVILERLTAYLERRAEIRKRIRSALTGPIIQLIVAVVVVMRYADFCGAFYGRKFCSTGQRAAIAYTNFACNFTHFYALLFSGNYSVNSIVIVGFRYWKSTAFGRTYY